MYTSITKNKNKIFIATKFGFRMKDETKDSFSGEVYVDCSAKYIKEAVEKSLKRLNTDVIDLYYAHRVDPNTPIEETIETMSQLVCEGKIKYLGLSECTAEDLKKAHAIHPISALQSEFSVLTQDIKNEILPLTKELNITLVPFAPLSRGLMSNTLEIDKLADTDFRRNLPRYSGEYFIRYLKENAKAVDLQLTKEDLEKIENILKKYPNVGPRYSQRENKFGKK